MKRTIIGLLAVVSLLLAAAVPASASDSDKEKLNWWDGTPVGHGSSTKLDRDDVSVKAKIRGLPEDYAVTVWAVVFELPENCDAADVVDGGVVIVPGGPGCGEDDVVRAFFGDNDVDLTVTNAGGGVTNRKGKVTVRSDIGGGDTLIGDGYVDNEETAEIHFVIRSHGPNQRGLLDTTTFAGGCVGADLPPGTVGTNVGECSDIQFSIHQA